MRSSLFANEVFVFFTVSCHLQKSKASFAALNTYLFLPLEMEVQLSEPGFQRNVNVNVLSDLI